MEPRVRVAALIRWQNRVLLCRQEKPGKEYWLLPGGGVEGGETLDEALRRELGEELGLWEDVMFEGPIAVAESIAPDWRPGDRHVVHIVFGVDLSDHSLEDDRDARRRRPRPAAVLARRARRGRPASADEAVRRALAAGRPVGVSRLALDSLARCATGVVSTPRRKPGARHRHESRVVFEPSS